MKNNWISVKNILALALVSSALVLVTVTCSKVPRGISNYDAKPSLPAQPYVYLDNNGGGGSHDEFISDQMIQDDSRNSISDASVALGRVLFYDKRLSLNNTIACASCHKQNLAFADNVAFSSGFGGKVTLRNSMAILNPVFNNNMFWDSRARDPLELSLMPVFNHIEMGMESDVMLVKKISGTDFYPALFQKAFGSTHVDREKISTAITHFLHALFSKKSKFDIGQNNGNNFANLSSLENAGRDLFFSARLSCTKCHAGENFSAPDAPFSSYGSPEVRGTANIGLDLNYKDNGKGDGKFKIPSLRNIALTAPYMHDGRFSDLDQVLDHYSHGIKSHAQLDENLKFNGVPVRLNLTEAEKMALIAFLNTLTDQNLITNPKFSDPFN